MTVEARALTEPWQAAYATGAHSGVSDTFKQGVGGGAGMRPHELLEAALASCMTIAARMELHDLGADDTGVSVRVEIERAEDLSRFHYALDLPVGLEAHRAAIMNRLERSPVRATLSKPLEFTAVEPA
ncbi:OsmC family protein [Microbacterium sp. X-17]|uniref:OsmC family protein n=1 Tax=Microbacterium sp. X-17 TaxID=3144404 RepID=UPI0031F56AB9